MPEIDAKTFDMAVMKDETAAPMRTLFSTLLAGEPYPVCRNHWRRLAVHVVDVRKPDLEHLLLKTLGVELMDVPI